MKRSHLWILTALLLVSCGGGDDGTGPPPPGGNDDLPDPVPTAAGVADGAPTTGTIGAGGGSVTSSNGAFTVNIPAGALASDTDITVQPITNTAWGGFGAGYELTPDGLTFSQPVELVLQVTPEDLAGSDPKALDIALQNDAGFWFILANRSYDEGAGTLTCTTTHFSSYAGVEGVVMRPTVATVGVSGIVNLSVDICHYQEISDDPNISAALLTCFENSIYPVGNWSVNGVPGGNTNLGTVVATGKNKARYTAPTAVPLVNPVAVSTQISLGRGTMILVSNIEVFNGFTGTITHVDEAGNRAVHTVTWTSEGALGGVESFEGTGTVVYTPGDSGCLRLSYIPDNGALEPLQTYMLLNRGAQPFQVTVTSNANWLVTDCTKCGDSDATCQDYIQFVGFGDGGVGGTGTLSSDEKTITGYFLDINTGENWSYQFTR